MTPQGGHKPGKPGVVRDFYEHGILREFCEFCATSRKTVTNKVFLVRHTNICVNQLLTG